MDTSITHALEIGLSFILFVIAISTFTFMNGQTSGLIDVAKSNNEVQHQVSVHNGNVNEEVTSLEEIYCLLTVGELGGKDNWINETSYLSSTNTIRITIDGIDYSPVKDYIGQQSLRASLLSLTSHSYDKDYYVDDDGKIIEIQFTGR